MSRETRPVWEWRPFTALVRLVHACFDLLFRVVRASMYVITGAWRDAWRAAFGRRRR